MIDLNYSQFLYFYIALLLIIVLLVIFLIKLFTSRKAKSYDDVHGTAHWATAKEIQNMGILDNQNGCYIGGWRAKSGETKYLRHDGAEHILAFAPTRSGKGVGLVLPTLLSWSESCVVLDIKGENWELTSGWRQKYASNLVLKFDPTANDGSSIKFNPLEEVRLNSDYDVGDVQNLAMMIIDTDGKGLHDYWSKAGFSLLSAFILHTLYQALEEKKNASLATIYATINNPTIDIKDTLNAMLEYKHKLINGKKTTHPTVAMAIREALNKADAELSGVIGTISSNLGLYADPIIGSNLAYSEFKIKDLMNHAHPISLYLVIKPNSIDRIKPLIRLMLNQILRILISDLKFNNGVPIQNYNHKMLLMLDEFASLGKLEIFQTSLAYMAGYGIKSYIILQDLSQLYNAYGKDEAIISNAHVRIAYAPNKVETAELLSKMSGTTTVVKKVRTSSGSKTGLVLNQVSENYQEVQRALLTIDECMSLPSLKKNDRGVVVDSGDMLIFIAGNSPIYGKQILYFNDMIFSARAKVHPPLSSDKVKEIVKIDSLSLNIETKESSSSEEGVQKHHQRKRGLSL